MEPSPQQSDVLADELRSRPFGPLLIKLLEQAHTGTLLVYAEDDSLYTAVFFEAGFPVCALAEHEGEHNLGTLLIPLCAWCSGRFEFIEGQDLVGERSTLHGRIDPLALVTAAARGPMREELIEHSMRVLSRAAFRRDPQRALERYGFTVQERLVVSAIEAATATTLEDVRSDARVPERVLRRVLHVLHLSHGIAPVQLPRAASGTVRTESDAARGEAASRANPSETVRTGRAMPDPGSSAALASRPVPRPAQPPATSMPSGRSQPSGSYAVRRSGPASGAPKESMRPSRPSQPSGSHVVRRSGPAGNAAPGSVPASRPSQPSGSHVVRRSGVPSGLPPSRSSRPAQPAAGSQQRTFPPGRSHAPGSRPAPSASTADSRALRVEAEALWKAAEMLAERGDFDAALQTARKAVKLGHAAPEHDALLGWLIFQHGGAERGAGSHVWKCLDRALTRDPLCEQALYYTGMVLNLTGQPEQAYSHFQRLLMVNPRNAAASREVRIYEMRKEHERQQSGFLRRLLTGRPGKPDE